MRLKISAIFLILILSIAPLSAHRQKMIDSNGIELWTETYGKSNKTPLLLIAGAAAQSIMWPHDFCKSLAKEGFFVIRYDHRDVGLSTAIDYQKNPYTVMDLTKDAIGILDHYKIQKAHIIGLSMGGQIAQFIGAYFPERASTLTLMATSATFEPGLEAFNGGSSSKLSSPENVYLTWAKNYFTNMSGFSEEEKREEFMKEWEISNGNGVDFDKEYYLQFMKQHFARSKHPNNALNHVLAMKGSYEDHSKAISLIKTPTLIIHGRHDPVFPIDHGENLHEVIPGSQLMINEAMGHLIPAHAFKDVVEAIVKHGKPGEEKQ